MLENKYVVNAITMAAIIKALSVTYGWFNGWAIERMTTISVWGAIIVSGIEFVRYLLAKRREKKWKEWCDAQERV